MKIMRSLFTLLCISFTAVLASSLYSRVTPKACQKPAIVFDLGGVLFNTDSSVVRKEQLGTSSAIRYALSHGAGSQKICANWFDALTSAAEYNNHAFSFKKEDGSTVIVKDEHGNALPDYMVEWLSGARSNQSIFDEICAGIDAQNMSDFDKTFMKNMTKNFLPDSFVASRKVIKEMIPLVEKLKEEGFPLLILSNWDKESFELMCTAYPELFGLFDGYIVSGYEQLVKPDPSIYQACEQRYPHTNYIFLDDQKDNRIAARECGWKTVKIATGKPNCKKIKKKINARAALCQEAAHGIELQHTK